MNFLYDIEKERAIIGAILFENKLIDLINITPEHFYNTNNQKALKGILNLHNQGKKRIYCDNLVEEVRGEYKEYHYLEMTENGIEKKVNFLHNQERIIELYQRRITKHKLLQGVEDLSNGKDANIVLSEIEKSMDTTIKSNIEVKPIFSGLEKAINQIEVAYKKGGKITGMVTGYKKLDMLLNGITKKTFTVIGARPSKGKTAFALELAMRLGINNKVLFFSLEMPEELLCRRMISNQSKIPLDNLQKGCLTTESFETMLKATNVIESRNIEIVDNPATTIEDIKTISTIKKKRGGLDVIIVDYLTCCSSNQKFATIREEVNHISKQLRILSGKLDVVVICLAQLNRSIESRTSQVPFMSDLKESGNIEQDANIILFLSEPEKEEIENNMISEQDKKFKAEILNLTIAKNRDGQKDVKIQYKYYKRTQIIEEI